MIHETIPLREQINGKYIPTLTTYIINDPLQQGKKRPAVLICPGGGYEGCSLRESEPIALQYNSFGFHAFVLKYSVAPCMYPDPMVDAFSAMRIIRENAEKWCILPDKIAVCGFSAGGHLAASLGTLSSSDLELNMSETDKPNAMILCYPVITSGEYGHDGSFCVLCGGDNELKEKLSLEKHVTKDTPPAFLWHTFNDELVPVENSLLFASALRRNDVPFELHIYHDGPHGLSLANTEVQWDKCYPHVQGWIELSADWLKEIFDIPKTF